MRKVILFLAIAIQCEAATVTYPANPNFYKYVPDQNESFRVMTKSDRKLDDKIRKKLQIRLTSSYEGQIKFDVNNGNVALYGFVGNIWDKDAIEQKVRNVDGVKTINNQITVQTNGTW